MGWPTLWGVAPPPPPPPLLPLASPGTCAHLLWLHPLLVTLTSSSPHFLSQDHYQEGSGYIHPRLPWPLPKNGHPGLPLGPPTSSLRDWEPPGGWPSPKPRPPPTSASLQQQFFICALTSCLDPVWVRASACFPCPRHPAPVRDTTVSCSARPQLPLPCQPSRAWPRLSTFPVAAMNTQAPSSGKSTPSEVPEGAEARTPCTHACTAALLAATKWWQQPKRPPMREWVSRRRAPTQWKAARPCKVARHRLPL